MEVRGICVSTVKEFVKLKFEDRYKEWINSLSLESKKIITSEIELAKWYPIFESMIIPTEMVCHLFYYDNYKGAWEIGRFSTDLALNHIYTKIFNFTSIDFILNHAPDIMYSYYRPCKIEVGSLSENNKKLFIRLVEFPEPNKYVEYRIGGWLERAFEISGIKNAKIEITKSLINGDKYTEFFLLIN